MAIAKVVFVNENNVSATWIDATTATAAAADITAPKTAMLANGVMTTGTGSGGGGDTNPTAEPKDVNFIDYDGTIRYSYTKSEFADLDSLPANPSHAGLTAQGWNWTKAQIATQLTATPNQSVWVGQMYITTSGDTEIDVSFVDAARLAPTLTIAVNGTITVDWGDNTTPDTVTGTSLTTRKAVPHTYATVGDYMMKIHVVSGAFAFASGASYQLLRKATTGDENRVYANCVRAVRLGSGITGIAQYAFYQCCALAYITLPNTITGIDGNAFAYCVSLSSITIPSDVTTVAGSWFSYCYALSSVAIPSGLSRISASMFYNNYAIAVVTIPSGATSIGNNAFYYCYSLSSLSIPSDITSIDAQAFYNCRGLGAIHFKATTPPEVANSNVFNNLPNDCIIYVPTGYLSAYTGATNYPSSSTYTYVEE